MSDNLQTIKARSVQTAAPFHGSVLEGGTFLHLREHRRSGFVINLHLIEQRTALSHIYREISLLAYPVIPILMVRGYRYNDVVSSDLCAEARRPQHTHQNTYNY